MSVPQVAPPETRSHAGRAEVALLALQLRTAIFEAEQAEAESAQALRRAEALEAERTLLRVSLEERQRRLRVELAAALEEARAAAAATIAEARREAVSLVAAARARAAEAEAVVEAEAAVAPEADEPEVVGVAVPTPSGAAAPPVPPDQLAEVVRAVVAATLAEARAAGLAAGPRVVAVDPRLLEGGPMRRRVLHADVVLPLVAVLLVFVVLVAWVG